MPQKSKPTTVGRLMKKGYDPVGLHVTMEAYVNGEVRDLLGTVKEVMVEDLPVGLSRRLVIHHFNGQPWPVYPLPAHVHVIERD